MKKDWLKYLNPFHFEKRFLLWMIWVNIILCCLLLPAAVLMAFWWSPSLLSLGLHSRISDTWLENEWNVGKLRQIVLVEDAFARRFMRESAYAFYGAASTFSAMAVLMIMNAFYLYKAHMSLTGAEDKAKSDTTP